MRQNIDNLTEFKFKYYLGQRQRLVSPANKILF